KGVKRSKRKRTATKKFPHRDFFCLLCDYGCAEKRNCMRHYFNNHIKYEEKNSSFCDECQNLAIEGDFEKQTDELRDHIYDKHVSLHIDLEKIDSRKIKHKGYRHRYLGLILQNKNVVMSSKSVSLLTGVASSSSELPSSPISSSVSTLPLTSSLMGL